MTEDELAELRSIIGSATPPTDEDLAADYERLGSVDAVAAEILRTRLADLAANPLKFSVEGDYSEDRTANLKLLSGQLALVEGRLAGGADGVVIARITRTSTRG